MENDLMGRGFLISLSRLPQGPARFKRKVCKKFFEGFENSEIYDADIDVAIFMEKSGRRVGVDCNMDGSVEVACDRCLEPVTLPVKTSFKLDVRHMVEIDNGINGMVDGGAVDGEVFEENEAISDDAVDGRSDDGEVIYLRKDQTDIDLSQIIYDYVCLSLPAQRFHEDGKCNPDALKYLENGIYVGTGSCGNSDIRQQESPFSVLKGILSEKQNYN